jgi:uncharacterized membrane protein
MGRKEQNWLLGELPAWVTEGIVDAAAAERLRQRYAVVGPARSWGMIVCGVIGALLLAAGVILVLAHNWDGLSRPMRALFAFLPLAIVQALAVMGCRNRWVSSAWRETIGMLWAGTLGACLALIGQTYHIADDTEGFLLAWALLTLPVFWFLRAVSVLAVFLAVALAWASVSKLDNGVSLLFWPLAAATVPVIWRATRENVYGHATVLMHWLLALASTAAVGITLEKVMPGLWMVIYAGFLGLLYLAGGFWAAEAPTLWQRPLHTIGSAGTVILIYLLTFDWPWREIGWQHLRSADIYRPAVALFDYALAALLPIAACTLLVTAVRRGATRRIPFGLLPVVVAVAYGITAWGDERTELASFLLCNAYLLGLGIAVLVAGVRDRRAGSINAGMLILIALILTRFFDSDFSFLAKGLVFIVLGTVFLGTNVLLAVRRRKGVAA